LLAFANLNAFLDYVVSISVLHHLIKNSILVQSHILIKVLIQKFFN
jgi:hypothetical protein